MDIKLSSRLRIAVEQIIRSKKTYNADDVKIRCEVLKGIKDCYYEDNLMVKIDMNKKEYKLFYDNKLTRLFEVNLNLENYNRKD